MGIGGFGIGNSPYQYTPSEYCYYKTKPHYKLFPFKWYDLWEEKWITDGTHVPIVKLTLLASRQPLKVVMGMKKLLK
jgi:hypothetical protein